MLTGALHALCYKKKRFRGKCKMFGQGGTTPNNLQNNSDGKYFCSNARNNYY